MQSIEKVLKGNISTRKYINKINSLSINHPSINEVLAYSFLFSAIALKMDYRLINNKNFLNRLSASVK